jgi:hypothetical protein
MKKNCQLHCSYARLVQYYSSFMISVTMMIVNVDNEDQSSTNAVGGWVDDEMKFMGRMRKGWNMKHTAD